MGKQWKQCQTLFLGVSKLTADGDCSHEIQSCLLLGRKVMTNLDSILKSRDITLPTKVCLVKAMVFPVVMYGCESWTVKKAVKVKVKSLSRVQLFVTPWGAAYQDPPSVGISRQEYWSGLPFPSPIEAFELRCWRRPLRVPWTARISNQSILKISPGCSLEGLMLKLKLQYFGHLI